MGQNDLFNHQVPEKLLSEQLLFRLYDQEAPELALRSNISVNKDNHEDIIGLVFKFTFGSLIS